MKKLLAAVLLVAFAAAGAFAADEMKSLKAKNGDVTINHTKHAQPGSCKACHGVDAPVVPAKITLEKDAAHKLCKGCHETKKAGPTKCGECHKK
jgi:hypothetical protein